MTIQNEKIIVTGGSGKVGQGVISKLLGEGYSVLNLDSKSSTAQICPTIIVDLNDAGQVHNSISCYNSKDRLPVEAVIHLAGIPRAYSYPNDVVFRNNVMGTYNILEACANYGIRKVVTASSECAYGFDFAGDFIDPYYFPVDEKHPLLAEDSYGLSKMVSESLAAGFQRRTGMQVISFRLGNVIGPEEYGSIQQTFQDPSKRRRLLWSYIDIRDVAQAFLLAIRQEGLGAEVFNLMADDTSSDCFTSELIKRFFPRVSDFRKPLEGRTALYSNEKLKLTLGWRQQYTLHASK